jgi:glycerate 2-kinase
MNNRRTAIDIFLAGVESVKPDNLIKSFVSLSGNTIEIENLKFDLKAIKNIIVVGAGKASAMMALSLESILGSRISRGHIITKYGHSVPLKYIDVTEAGHPVPDENGITGTGKIISIARQAGENDLLICLISGGGSSLMVDVPEGCDLEDLKELNNVLLKSGANITEMNCIRKHLSNLKGGLLSRLAYPARVVSLILSDVIGDPLDVIASGPTAPDPTTFSDAISTLRKFGIEDKIPRKILNVLQEGSENKRQETVKESDEILLQTSNLIIGNNRLALKAAMEKAEGSGYESRIITSNLNGDVADAAKYLVGIAKKVNQEEPGRKVCLLFAGEPTVKITGNGSGGRNQHLALIAASLIEDEPGITILSGGTDGTDGPTDAAGAVVDNFTTKNALDKHLDIERYLYNFDSYNFFKKEGGLLLTGPTQTNVMDLLVVLIN